MQNRVTRWILAPLAVAGQSTDRSMILRLAQVSNHKEPHTTEGIQRKVREKNRISLIPCQNTGIDRPKRDLSRVRSSTRRPQ
jgi:hypothetical protein